MSNYYDFLCLIDQMIFENAENKKRFNSRSLTLEFPFRTISRSQLSTFCGFELQKLQQNLIDIVALRKVSQCVVKVFLTSSETATRSVSIDSRGFLVKTLNEQQSKAARSFILWWCWWKSHSAYDFSLFLLFNCYISLQQTIFECNKTAIHVAVYLSRAAIRTADTIIRLGH